MPFELLFQIANTAALLCWIALIAAPRRTIVRRSIQTVVIVGLCVTYAVLVSMYFFRVEGGGFSTLAGVQRLFTSAPVTLAGWVHYLAFDLWVGLWIASRSDDMSLSRWIQAPILVTTFMLGPIGLLLFAAIRVSRSMGAPATSGLR
jgi:hypothetical protein